MSWLQTHKVGILTAGTALVPAVSAAVYYEQWWIAAVPFLIVIGAWGWQQPRWLFALMWMSIPFSFEYSFSDSLGTDLPDEPLMLAVTLLVVFHCIHRKDAFSFRFADHPLFICFVAWLGWMVIASLVSTAPVLSLKFLLAKSWYTGAFFLAPLIWVRSRQELAQLLYWIYVPLFVLMLISLIRHAFEGFSFATSSEVVQPYFRNHVVYSALLVTLAPVLYFRFRRDKRTWYRAAMLVLLIALFLSYARGAWLALLAGALAYWFLRHRLLTYGYVFGILIGLSVIVWLKHDDRYLRYAPDYRTTIFHPAFSDHWRATYQGKDVSTVERFYRWIAGVRMVEERPLTGFGPASFYSSYRSYTIPAYKTWVSNNPDRSTVHNYFLLTASEQGLPGLIIFLLLFGAMLFYAERLYHRGSDPWIRRVAAGIAVVAVMLGVVNFWSDLIETDKIGSLFFLLIALLLLLERSSIGIAAHVERVA